MSIDLEKASAFHRPTLAEYPVPRVNLLPEEIYAERRFRRTQVALAGVMAGVLLAVGAGYAVSVVATQQAEEALVAEQAQASTLAAEEAQYADVPRVLAEVESAQSARTLAMSNDVLWYEYLNRLAASYPKDVWLKDVTAVATASDPAAASAATTSNVATITFTGSALAHSDVAAWLDALATIEGFSEPAFTTADRTEVDGRIVVDFTSTVNVTTDALSHRFDGKDS